jgi:hypothetical protein
MSQKRDLKEDGVERQFGWPVAVVVVGGTILFVLQSAVQHRDFWQSLGVGGALLLLAWIGGLTRTVVDQRRRIAALESADVTLRAEFERRGVELDRLARAAMPPWLRVAVVHVEAHGGRVEPVPDGLRFTDKGGEICWTIQLPLPSDLTAIALNHHELHSRFGIDQRAFTTAVLDGA